MRINEVEEQLQISRANIRFYEKEGLIKPSRKANGYRDYSDEDFGRLKKIIIFRKIGMSIPDIREVLEGNISITDAVRVSIDNLNEQIKELNGALEVCKLIEKDSTADTAFNQEKYWDIIQNEEKCGQRFVELIKDYVDFEKNIFLSMWENAFFFVYGRKLVNHKGWIFATGIFLLVCIIRGCIYVEWHNGSFLYGFLYPLVLFVIISAISLPLYFINQKYKNVELLQDEMSQNDSKKHMFLALVAKPIGVFAYIFFILFGIPSIVERIQINYVYGKDMTFLITGRPFIIYCILGIYLLAVVLWLYSKKGIFPNRWDDVDGFKAHLPKMVKNKVLVFSVMIFMLGIVFYISWYDFFTEEGITTRRFFWTKEYTWEDVEYHTLSASFDGLLIYKLVMNDGHEALIMGGANASYNFPLEHYPEQDLDYGRYIARIMAEMGIEFRINDYEKIKDNLTYDYWKDYADDLISIVNSTPMN